MGEKNLNIAFFCRICSLFEGRGRYSPGTPTQLPHCLFFWVFLPCLPYSPRSKPPGLPVQSPPARQWGDACGPTHGTGRCKTPS